MTSLSTLGADVPTEVKVTGFDDVRYASLLQTPLTTIHQPCLELGATALTAMFARIANPTMLARDYLLDFKLVVRQSTALTNHGDTQIPSMAGSDGESSARRRPNRAGDHDGRGR
jgi:DNA-binding LacI/PurR family transcriptional regulator